MAIRLIGVPFDGMGRKPGQAGAPAALRAAGLEAALSTHVVVSRPDFTLPEARAERWQQLTEVVQTALSVGRCRGWSLAIYNPDLDPDGSQASTLCSLSPTSLLTFPDGNQALPTSDGFQLSSGNLTALNRSFTFEM